MKRWLADALHHALTIPEQFIGLPAEVLLTIVGYCALTTLVALAGWARLSARHSRVVRKATELEREHAELQAKYDAEVKWRTASEAAQASKPAERIIAVSSTDTQVREKVVAILDGLVSEGVITSYKTNFQAVSIVTTGIVTDRSKPTFDEDRLRSVRARLTQEIQPLVPDAVIAIRDSDEAARAPKAVSDTTPFPRAVPANPAAWPVE
jgi:hypothetical protein